jgi:hypothetical protein
LNFRSLEEIAEGFGIKKLKKMADNAPTLN